ncbi:MAG: 50S ribosomal protein L17 [Myxococcales bacterium]
MRHGMSGRQFNRSRAHYHSLMNNLATSLLKHEAIKTTLPKAKEMRPMVEKLITLGKKGTLHARRQAFRTIRDEAVLKKLFDEIAPRMKERQGGYTRILKLGFRAHDAADMAIIELVDHVPQPKAPKAAKAEETEGAEGEAAAE